MPSTYSPNLRIELIGTGEQAGTWGTTTNSNLGTLIEDAIAGYVSVSITSADQALTALNGAADQSRNMIINLTTTTTANFNVYIPPAEKFYVIRNTTAYTATIYNSTVLGNTTAAGTGVGVLAGTTTIIFSDATNVRTAMDSFPGGTTIGGNLIVNGNTTLGDTSGDTITFTGTVTSNLRFTDNTYDIGASGATRPRDFFLSRNATIGSLTSTRVPYASTGGLLVDSANMTFNGTRLTVADFADSSLTSGRVTYAGTGGNLTDSANLTFSGTQLSINGSGELLLLDGTTNLNRTIYLRNVGTGIGKVYTDGTLTLETIAAYPVTISTNNVSRATFDIYGNSGLGVTPVTTWGATYRVQQIGLTAAFAGRTAASQAYVSANWYTDGTNSRFITTAAATQYQQDAGNHYWFTAASGAAGSIMTGATALNQFMRLDSAGFLNITGDGARVVVAPSLGTNSALTQFTNTGGNAYVGIDNSGAGLGSAYALHLFHAGNYPIIFSANNVERGRFAVGGNFLVRADGGDSTFTSPGQIALKRSGDSPYISWHSNSGTRLGYLQLQAGGVAQLIVEANQPLGFGTNGTQHVHIATTGQVGVGTQSPSSYGRLVTLLSGSGGPASTQTNSGLVVGATGTSGVLDLGVDSTGGFYSWIQSRNYASADYYTLALNPISGSVGIGTVTPGAKLEIYGSGELLRLESGTSASKTLYFRNTGAANTALILADGILKLETNSGSPVEFSVSSTTRGRFDTSGNFQFNSGYGSVAIAYGVRAWVNFNGTGTVAIRASANVTSITDNGTGDYTVNITTAMPDANYAVAGCCSRDPINNPAPIFGLDRANPTTTAVSVQTANTANVRNDALFCMVTIVR